jgi:hypothetical protein
VLGETERATGAMGCAQTGLGLGYRALTSQTGLEASELDAAWDIVMRCALLV